MWQQKVALISDRIIKNISKHDFDCKIWEDKASEQWLLKLKFDLEYKSGYRNAWFWTFDSNQWNNDFYEQNVVIYTLCPATKMLLNIEYLCDFKS